MPGPAIDDALAEARRFLYSVQREAGHWCAELESNPTLTAEYVMAWRMLGFPLADRSGALVRYLRRQQNHDGGWGIAGPWRSDLSTTAECYLALRLLGISADDDMLRRAAAYIRAQGGIAKVRIFTRIWFAAFGLFPWDAVPAIPPEFILLPPSAPVNAYRLSSWARSTMIPLFIVFHHRPIYALPNGRSAENDFLDDLWLNPADKTVRPCAPLMQLVRESGIGWKSFFGLSDAFLRGYERYRAPILRRLALRVCRRWILERQEPEGDWAGILPPMFYGLLALTLEGEAPDSDVVRRGRQAIERFAWEDEGGLRFQACVSPVWDTVLATIGLLDAGADPRDPRVLRALDWIVSKQLLVDHGDWKVYRPKLESGGWSFEYWNSWYPDVDDTAAVLLALLKQDNARATMPTVTRALSWIVGMQNRDGGWAAFDVDNDRTFLNQIPFSDMDSLCDPSSPDVTGRVLEAFGHWLSAPHSEATLRRRVEVARDRALAYLRRNQEKEGAWYGRWGVNYVYGTSNVLCGLAALRLPSTEPMVERALNWLRDCQNPDGGWGESLESYADRRWMGKGPSTASQTAWGLMGALAYTSAGDASVARAAHWLIERQVSARSEAARESGRENVPPAAGRTWNEGAFTGTGFPQHFYIRYHYYRHYFPMMALGRYRRRRLSV